MGQENHAGTTPMNMRDDALSKAASLITYVVNWPRHKWWWWSGSHCGEISVLGPNASLSSLDWWIWHSKWETWTWTTWRGLWRLSPSHLISVMDAHSSEPALCDPCVAHHGGGLWWFGNLLSSLRCHHHPLMTPKTSVVSHGNDLCPIHRWSVTLTRWRNHRPDVVNGLNGVDWHD